MYSKYIIILKLLGNISEFIIIYYQISIKNTINVFINKQ